MRRLLLAVLLGTYFALFSSAQAFPLVAKCDQNFDSTINSVDVGLVARGWGTTAGDVNGDGTTNSIDLGLCAHEFGKWSYPDDGDGDPAGAVATIDALPPLTQTALVQDPTNTAVPTATSTPAFCPECVGTPTSVAPTVAAP